MIKIKTSEVNQATEVYAIDEPGPGGAHHEYLINLIHREGTPLNIGSESIKIRFQKGPIQENGVNGCQIEDLIAIAIHRLECFQAGNFACMENAESLYHLNLAMKYLDDRTKERRERNVEDKREL